MTEALFTKILVGSDGSSSAAQAIARAASLAQSTGGSLEIIGAVPSPNEESALVAKLGASADELTAAGLQATSSVKIGDPVEVILATAEEIGADLIILGNKGMTGARRFILGSVPDKVSHQAHCSVMIARTT